MAAAQLSKLPTLLPTDGHAVYVVTGGNRGLGLEHVRQFLEKTDAHVVATTRHVEAAHNLQYFIEQGKADRLTVVSLNLEDEESIQAAAAQVAEQYPQGIDMLLNNAGMQEPIGRAVDTTCSEYMHVLMTNVVGPFLTTKHFLPLLRKKKTRVVVNISSLYESMNADYNNTEGMHNTSGCVLLASNTSKAAINMQSAVLANDLKSEGFTVVSLDTGWVRTATGSNSSEALGGAPPLDVLTSVAGQQKVIMALTPKKTGQYLNWNGKAPKDHPASHSIVSAAPPASVVGYRQSRLRVRMVQRLCQPMVAKLAF